MPYSEDRNECDYYIIDRKTGQQLAKFSDPEKVIPYAWKVGRDTVDIKKVKRKEKTKMKKPVQETNSVVNLSEMKIEKVKEDLLLPKTNNPEKEAEDLTDDTGIYHYAVDDDMTGKPAIVRTNVKALNEQEWIKKSFYTDDEDVVEPNDFEKNDQYDVSSVRQVAEGYDRDAWEAGYEAFENGQECPSDPSGKDGWMEAKKEHRKAGQMDEADYDRGNSDNWDDDHTAAPDWTEVAIGICKHNYLPLAYDDNSGQVVLYDIENAADLDDAETVGVFSSVEEMNDWIAANIRQDVAEQYRQIAEANVSTITTAERGSDQEQSLYGPAPEDDQNDMEFDKDGKFVIEAKFKPKDSSFESHVDLADRDDVEVEVYYEVEESDPSVGYAGGVMITDVVEKGTDHDLMDVINPKDANRLFDEAQQHASDQVADYGDYKYDQMRDERMEREFDESDDVEEGKDYRYDPDAEDEDYDRQDRFKQRKQDKKDRHKEVDEGIVEEDGDITRVYLLSVDFTVDRIELEHKGMADIDSAVALASDGVAKDKVMNQIQMGGLPTSFELNRDNAYTIIVLDTTLRGAIESMVSIELCQELLAELEISEDVFYGFLIQAKTGDMMDGSTELDEDEDFQAPEFVVSSEKLYANEMAEDPMFIQVMNDAYLTVAEKCGEKVEDFNPDMNQVEEIVHQGIDSYPNGQKYSFMMGDPMAMDAIYDAFNILWDQGKIGPEHIS